MFAPAIRSHFLALALTALVTLACLGAVYTAWLMPDDSLGVATAPLARLQSLFDGSASAPADPPLETFLPGEHQNLTPAQAVMANLASPLARINPPPPAFNPAWLAPTDLAAATECMARAIYYEANGEPAAGQLAVAQVILNRVRHPRFPKTVCGVVGQGSDRQTGCQFTFTCDGSPSRPANPAGLARARGVASAALHGAVFELPLAQVLIRAPVITPALLQTAMTLGTLRGLALALVMAALAWPAAWIYGDARLVPLLLFLGLAPALRGMISPAMAHYARAMEFRPDVVMELLGKLAALALASVFAWRTHSFWAIAVGTVAAPAFMMLGSYGLAPMRLRLRLTEWRQFSSFLYWTSAAQVVAALNWQADRLLLARMVPRATLGLFSMASDLATLPEEAICKPIYRPLLSAFARAGTEPAARARAYLLAATAVLSAGMPVMVGLGLLAQPAVRLVMGAHWLGAAPYLGWLAVLMVLPLANAAIGPLALAEARTDILLRLNTREAMLRLPLTLLGLWLWGPWGIVAARGLTWAGMRLFGMIFVRQVIGLGVMRQLVHPWRTVAAGAVLAAVLLVLRPMLGGLGGLDLVLGLCLCAVLGLGAYVGAMGLLWLVSGQPEGVERMALGWLGKRLHRWNRAAKTQSGARA